MTVTLTTGDVLVSNADENVEVQLLARRIRQGLVEWEGEHRSNRVFLSKHISPEYWLLKHYSKKVK